MFFVNPASPSWCDEFCATCDYATFTTKCLLNFMVKTLVLFYEPQKDLTVGQISEKDVLDFFDLAATILKSERELNCLSFFRESTTYNWATNLIAITYINEFLFCKLQYMYRGQEDRESVRVFLTKQDDPKQNFTHNSSAIGLK